MLKIELNDYLYIVRYNIYSMICDGYTCFKYSLYTFISVIIGTILLHLLGYIAFTQFYVDKYYAGDLIQWRENELAKIPDV